MSVNTLGQYTPSHKTWDHVGNITPMVEISEGIRPAENFKVAEWLPVQFFDKYYENWFVVTTGKIVACDNSGDLVPSQYATSSVDIVYTADDVTAGTTDVETGSAVTAAKTVAVSSVTTFLGQSGVSLAVSKPVGIAPYNYLQWAGGDGFNPANYNQHNYNMQHGVAVLCDYYIQLPLVPATASAESVTFGGPDSNISVSAPLSNLPVAGNTARTAWTFAGGDSSTLFVNQRTTAALVTAAGDYHIDQETGVVTVYATSQPTSITLTYYHYASAPASVSKFASAVGDLDPGDFVKSDTNSNFQLDSSPTVADTIGQVLAKENVKGKDLLDKVRTQFSPALNTTGTGLLPGTSGQADQMPGTATGGVPGQVHFAGAADTVVRVNLINR